MYILCANLDCPNRLMGKTWKVLPGSIKDGVPWICDDCRQSDEEAPTLKSAFGAYDHYSVSRLKNTSDSHIETSIRLDESEP